MSLRDEYTYNEEKWGNSFDPTNENDLNTDTVNGYIMYYIQYYQREKFRDRILWDYFWEDFEGWTKDIFNLSHKNLVQVLRDHLRVYGCYVGRDRRTLPTNLQIAVEEEEYHKWTKEEIDQQLREGGEFDSW